MEFVIKHRFNGEVIFKANIDCNADASYSVQLGLAAHAALAARANLSKANLSEADLSEADLSKANLSEADLSWANLSKANLSVADLSKANLSKANLSEADLSKADLSWANLSKADLSWANLSEADLSKANLSEADLSWANLSVADLSVADLSKANLSEADLRYIKHDVWGILLNAIPEVPALRQAIVDGKVDGSTYEGPCACLCGTIANVRGSEYEDMPGISPDANSMAERFFMGIKEGDTPQTNSASKVVLGWVDEFLAIIAKYDANLNGRV